MKNVVPYSWLCVVVHSELSSLQPTHWSSLAQGWRCPWALTRVQVFWSTWNVWPLVGDIAKLTPDQSLRATSPSTPVALLWSLVSQQVGRWVFKGRVWWLASSRGNPAPTHGSEPPGQPGTTPSRTACSSERPTRYNQTDYWWLLKVMMINVLKQWRWAILPAAWLGVGKWGKIKLDNIVTNEVQTHCAEILLIKYSSQNCPICCAWIKAIRLQHLPGWIST